MLTVAAFYRFTRFDDPALLKAPLARLACGQGVRGTILLAPEGINGTIAGSRAGVEAVIAHLRTLPGCADLDWKESAAETMPFGRLKVRLKREIVTMGQPDVDPSAAVGRYVEPADWNSLISAPDVAVIDTRNAYEVAIGSFQGAEDPGTESFGAFPAWWEANRERFAGKRLALFCTGGIRCEKATSWLVSQGIEEVHHLRGGILSYLENVPATDTLWSGACFVFDGRVAVGHGLTPGSHGLCHACRRPVSDADRAHPAYEEGVSCARCVDAYSAEDRARFRERQRQMTLAEHRGTSHLGAA